MFINWKQANVQSLHIALVSVNNCIQGNTIISKNKGCPKCIVFPYGSLDDILQKKEKSGELLF